MKEKAAELLKKTANYHNFVLSSGCDAPPGTPINNMDAFYDTLAVYNTDYKNKTLINSVEAYIRICYLKNHIPI
jgi:hypothetical protein